MTEVSKEYGTALFMLACENNKKEEYADALLKLEEVFLETPEYQEFLASPSIPLSERLCAIDNAFSKNIPEEVLSYLKLLCEKGRISCFNDSLKEYTALYDESKKISNAKVVSAVELNEEEKKKVCEKLENMLKTTVEIEYATDPSLLGGILIETEGKVLDGSLRTRLHDIKEVINK